MKINTLEQAQAELTKYIPMVRELLGKNITVERIRPLMNVLGNPQDKLKIIHIAGTSGKTSTAYYIASLLRQAGQKVGLTVSPHIDSITERVQIDLKPLSEAEFCGALSEFLELIKNVDPEPTYFELLIAFAYWYFAKTKVDYAVVETGLGGLHDATNIAGKPNKICVITDIGFDHIHVLGKTLPEIASQKAGIIHPGNQVFMYKQPNQVADTVKAIAEQKKAKLNLLSISDIRACKTELPDFQKRNWCLSLQIYEYIAKRDDLPGLGAQQLANSQATVIPGRMESHRTNDKTIIMDGAHNAQKMQALASSFSHKYPGQKVPVLFSLKTSKDCKEVLKELLPICSELIITQPRRSKDVFAMPLDAKFLADEAKKVGLQYTKVEPDSFKAYKLLLNTKSDMVIVTGSFYLISDLRRDILKSI